jgi:hypothetical protein
MKVPNSLRYGVQTVYTAFLGNVVTIVPHFSSLSRASASCNSKYTNHPPTINLVT